MRFATRLVAGTLLVLLLAMAVLLFAAERSLRRDLVGDLARSLESEAGLIREALSSDSTDWNESLRRLAGQNNRRITIVDAAGRVRADSDFPPGPLPAIESHLDRPEIRAALDGKTGIATRRSETVGRTMLYVAVPGGPGAIRAAANLSQVDQVVRRAQSAVTGAALLALLVGAIFALVAGRSIARPLTGITTAARAIAAGSPPRFPRSGIPDIDALVQALRQMHRQLADRFDELRREQAESAALVESMVEGVIAADERGRIATANPAARRLLGYDQFDALPDLAELFRVKAAREVVDAVLAGAPVQDREVELDGRSVLLNARPLPAGGAVLVMHDLTELRRLEAIRRDFVANVSHELKTPLTSISGYAETLLSLPPDPEMARVFLGTILGNARRMQRLVDDLLDLSRIEAGRWQPTLSMVDVGAVTRESWMALAGRADTRQVSFDVQVEPGAELLCADLDALRQIVTNLLDNSLRYTPTGGRITCTSARRDGGIALAVRDTGVGSTSEHLPRIFERFYRADASRSREEGGTGLGLAI
ncbi:MAG TPA: histidine kinase dimerization/phospho-acceptor domain-containing protein, partial [Gemmatimonadales bacterium]|nr:histidine kinase dimerization/phospho-acceptor domain-containing protein [Gemmatimonadales bacterium]